MEYFSIFNSRLSRKNELSDFDIDIRMNPHLPQPYNERGNKRLSLNDYHGALEDFSIAVDLDPKYPIHFCNRGIAKFHLQDFKGAIDDFTQAINIKPRSAWFNFNRGLAKCASGDFKGSIDDFTTAIESEPKNVEAHILRGKARGGFVKGCYNPLKDTELLSIFQGDRQTLEQKISEIEKSRLLHYLAKSWGN